MVGQIQLLYINKVILLNKTNIFFLNSVNFVMIHFYNIVKLISLIILNYADNIYMIMNWIINK